MALVALGLWLAGLLLAGCGGSSSSLEGVWSLEKMAVGDKVSELSGVFALMKEDKGSLNVFELKAGGVVHEVDGKSEATRETSLVWSREGDRVIVKMDPAKVSEGAEAGKEEVFEVRDGQLWFDITAAFAKGQDEMAALALLGGMGELGSAMLSGEKVYLVYMKK
ncbi:MAG: hypothetical protein CSA07_01775 [Bacteroidia bacterium]|nr:MAG: hypothetical protein CSA07_01775 [Bacteroidia bacterium]